MLAREKTALGGVVYGRKPWRNHLDAIVEAVEGLLKCCKKAPLTIVVDCAGGAVPQHGPYHAPALKEALQKADTVAIGVEGADVRIGIELGHGGPEPPPNTAPPPAFFFALRWPAARTGPNAAVQAFTELARRSQPLHGGLDAYCCLDAAVSDVSLIAAGLHQLTAAQRLRWQYDSTHMQELWTHARRLYAVTLLGKALHKPGDLRAAREAGAARITALNECLMIEALPNLEGALDPGWRIKQGDLLKWLWPRTLKNPTDHPPTGFKKARARPLGRAPSTPSHHNHSSAL